MKCMQLPTTMGYTWSPLTVFQTTHSAACSITVNINYTRLFFPWLHCYLVTTAHIRHWHAARCRTRGPRVDAIHVIFKCSSLSRWERTDFIHCLRQPQSIAWDRPASAAPWWTFLKKSPLPRPVAASSDKELRQSVLTDGNSQAKHVTVLPLRFLRLRGPLSCY